MRASLPTYEHVKPNSQRHELDRLTSNTRLNGLMDRRFTIAFDHYIHSLLQPCVSLETAISSRTCTSMRIFVRSYETDKDGWLPLGTRPRSGGVPPAFVNSVRPYFPCYYILLATLVGDVTLYLLRVGRLKTECKPRVVVNRSGSRLTLGRFAGAGLSHLLRATQRDYDPVVRGKPQRRLHVSRSSGHVDH